MQIYPINKSSNNYNFNKIKRPNPYNTNFGHHPDFVEWQKSCDIMASTYFRRGRYYDSASKNFIDVISTLKLFFDKNKNKKVTMLIGGVADSQECYSDLAVIKSLIGKKKIDSVLDLYTIDLQSKPDEKTLILQSFCDGKHPKYVPECFVRENTFKYGNGKFRKYKVKPDIYQYLASVYNNPEKASWETRIQEKIKAYPDNTFDIISVNNTLIYFYYHKTMMDTLNEIQKKLKPGGVFITDPHKIDYQEVFSPDICNEIYDGIYQKIFKCN